MATYKRKGPIRFTVPDYSLHYCGKVKGGSQAASHTTSTDVQRGNKLMDPNLLSCYDLHFSSLYTDQDTPLRGWCRLLRG